MGRSPVITGPAMVDNSGRAYTSSAAGGSGNGSSLGNNTNVNLIPKKTSSEVTVAQSVAGLDRFELGYERVTPSPKAEASRPPQRGQLHEAIAEPITSWRDVVLPQDQPLASLLDCFSPAATANLLPRTEGDHVVLLVPSHAFDLGANLSDDTIRQMRPIMNALLDDTALRITIAVAPTNVSQETIDYFAPGRIKSVTQVLVGVGIESSRITSDPRSVQPAHESNAVNLILRLYRK